MRKSKFHHSLRKLQNFYTWFKKGAKIIIFHVYLVIKIWLNLPMDHTSQNWQNGHQPSLVMPPEKGAYKCTFYSNCYFFQPLTRDSKSNNKRHKAKCTWSSWQWHMCTASLVNSCMNVPYIHDIFLVIPINITLVNTTNP